MQPELISAQTLSQTEFDQAEALLIGLLRDAYPALDLRRGTALRDLLVRPNSAVHALETRRNDELMRTRSLIDMAAQPSGDDADAANAILANFNTSLRKGYAATGTLKVSVDAASTYRVAAGAVFVASDSQAAYTAITTTVAQVSDGTLRGPDGDGYMYFTLPVSAQVPGQVAAGTAFTAAVPFSGYVSAVSYADFTPGRADETLSEALSRLPATVASRGLVTRSAISTAFTDPTSSGYNANASALSIQGMGDPAQQRDRRNVHGLSLGGRIDVYARTFTTPPLLVVQKSGTLQTDGTYRVVIRPPDAPGLYAVRSVTYDGAVPAPGYDTDGVTAVGSFAFTTRRYSATDGAPDYRFATEDSTVGTAYHGMEILVAGVDAADAAPVFRVELYAAADIGALQAYADRPDVRNTSADLLVRAPFVCLVGLRLTVKAPASTAIDITAMKEALVDAVNANSFTGVLTMSELVSAAHRFPITSVDTAPSRHGGFELRGYVFDGAGTGHALQGHRLDIADITDESGLLTRDTAVFATDIGRISIEVQQV